MPYHCTSVMLTCVSKVPGNIPPRHRVFHHRLSVASCRCLLNMWWLIASPPLVYMPTYFQSAKMKSPSQAGVAVFGSVFSVTPSAISTFTSPYTGLTFTDVSQSVVSA